MTFFSLTERDKEAILHLDNKMTVRNRINRRVINLGDVQVSYHLDDCQLAS